MRAVVSASLALAVSAQSACFFPRRWDPHVHTAAYVVDAVLIVGGAVIWASYANEPPACDCQVVGLIVGVPAILVGTVGAIINAGMTGESTPVQPLAPPLRAPAPADDAEHDALEAAAAGDCAAVRAAIARLRQIDPARAGAVDSEPDVAACLR